MTKAAYAMTRNVVCVTPDESLDSARDIMKEWDIRHLPVTQDGRLVGIVSDRDILLHSRRSDDGDIEVSPLTIEDVMTKHVRTCSPEDSISEIADTMIGFKIDSVPVVDEGELIGLVTSTDLLELLREREASGIARKLPFNYDIKVYRGGAAL